MITYYLVKLRSNSNEIHGSVDAENVTEAIEHFHKEHPTVLLNEDGYWRENHLTSWVVAERYSSYYPRPS